MRNLVCVFDLSNDCPVPTFLLHYNSAQWSRVWLSRCEWMFTVQFVVDSNFTAPSITSVFVNTNVSFSIGLTFSGPLFSVHPMHHLRSGNACRLPLWKTQRACCASLMAWCLIVLLGAFIY